MLSSFIYKLNEPFPETRKGLDKVKDISLTALFVAVFLYTFNPFGMQNMPQGLGFSAVIFGLITFLFYLFYHHFVARILKIYTDIPSWTLWKWMLLMMLLTLWIALGNFLFLVVSLPENFNLSDFIRMLKYTFMVGIIPMFVSGMMIQLTALKRNLAEAESFPPLSLGSSTDFAAEGSPTISFEISGGEDISIAIHSIYFIEAMQNYLIVHHEVLSSNQDVSSQANIKQTILRLTMTKAAAMIEDKTIQRCHRSFIVNTQKIHEVKGNAQGLKLRLKNISEAEIPVSRRYISTIKDAFSSKN